MRSRLVIAVALLGLAVAPAAHATVPQDGSGFGISDPDPLPTRSLGPAFHDLQPRVFRMLVPWNIADDPGLRLQAADRLAVARREGVTEVIVSFARPDVYVTPEEWLAKVGAFVDEFAPQVDWWTPVNEPNQRSGRLPNWMITTPRSGRPVAPYGYGVDVAARYSVALAGLLAARPGERQLSPDFHDDYDFDLGDGTPLRTVDAGGGRRISTVADYVESFRAAGGQFGAALGWHPYYGANARDMTGTEDVAAAVPGLPIWVTEVGAAGSMPGGRFTALGDRVQLETVRWLTADPAGLGAHPRVARMLYWHVLDHNPVWDTALVSADGTRRPAWYAWCAASHGGRAGAPDCSPGGIWREGAAPAALFGEAPALISSADGTLWLFARGEDGAVWVRRRMPAAGGEGWSAWESLGGLLASPPRAEPLGRDGIRLVARGSDGALWEKRYTGGEWLAWAPVRAAP